MEQNEFLFEDNKIKYFTLGNGEEYAVILQGWATKSALYSDIIPALSEKYTVIFPALSAMRLCKSFRGVVIASSVISVVAATVGILLSLLLSSPVGPTIVAADIVVFAVFFVIGAVTKRNA